MGPETGTKTNLDACLSFPFRVGGFEAVNEIGRGGMGIVFRARDLELGRQVALKRPLNDLSEKPRVLKRFMREARTASQIIHPNVATIFEVFEHDGAPWLAMELVEGRKLASVLASDGALPLEDVVRHAEGIADALDAAHRCKILHRDINPNNVIIGDDGRARLTDFGIARVFEEKHVPGMTVTEEGMVVGTRGYMSPEQVLGYTLDPRSDIFSLGLLLYEMCAGRPAFKATGTGEWIDALLHREPTSLTSIDPSLPEDLIQIVEKATAKKTDARFQTAAEMRDALRILRRSVESTEFALTTVADRRKRRRWQLASVAAAVVAGGALTAGWQLVNGSSGAGLAAGWSPRKLTNSPGWEGEPALSPDGSLVAYTSDEAGSPDIWLMDVKGGEALQLTSHQASDRAPAWLPDGSAIVFVSNRLGDPSVWQVPRLGGTPTEILPNAEGPAVSPDGSSIAYVRKNETEDRRIAISPLSDPNTMRWLTGPENGAWEHTSPAWSPDGLEIVFFAYDGLGVVSVIGNRYRKLTPEATLDREPAWGSDGRYVYFSSEREGTTALWRIASSGGPAERLTMGTGPERRPAISSDGSRIAYATLREGEDVMVLDRQTGRSWSVPDRGSEAHPALAPDGGAIAFISDRSGSNALWLQALENGAPKDAARRVTTDAGSLACPEFSPDGRWVAGFRGDASSSHVWVMAVDGGRPLQFTDFEGENFHPTFSPDGNRLAFISNRNGGQHVWVAPIVEGKPAGPPEQVTWGESSDLFPVWLPDGERIAYVGSSAGESEVWVVEADTGAPATQVTRGAQAEHAEWDALSETLLVSGWWRSGRLEIRHVDLGDGSIRPLDPAIAFGTLAEYALFSLSADGRFIAWARHTATGDIWVADVAAGSL